MGHENTTIQVHVQPGARSNQIVGFKEEVLQVRVTAPPRKGQANQALVSIIARALGLSESDVSIVRGHTSRHKVLAIEGLDPERLRHRLSGIAAPEGPPKDSRLC